MKEESIDLTWERIMDEVLMVQQKVISKEVAISWIKSYIKTHEEGMKDDTSDKS